jgi:tetratricopeptide (TPR) repeat protein
MTYWLYYLAWLLAAWGARRPALLLGVLVFLAIRRWLPDPSALWDGLRRLSALRALVALNPANVPARRDLALLLLELRRPRAALEVLAEARARTPDDAELLYLTGLAHHRAGQHEAALDPLVRSVDVAPSFRYGAAFLLAGDALLALGRDDAAIDAYERYASINGSDVAVHVRLARAWASKGDRPAAKRAIQDAVDTFRHLPPSHRLQARGAWASAQLARVWLLREPPALLFALAVTVACAFMVRAAIPAFRELLNRPSAAAMADEADRASDERDPLNQAFAACGTQDVGDFQGRFEIPDSSLFDKMRAPSPSASASAQADYARSLDFERAQWRNFTIAKDRITSGTTLVQEFCLSRVLARTKDHLRAEAVWHEDVHDPGDASLVEIEIVRDAAGVRFGYGDLGAPITLWYELRRAP